MRNRKWREVEGGECKHCGAEAMLDSTGTCEDCHDALAEDAWEAEREMRREEARDNG